ncbi:VOC family protein [Neolewinella agarilytica]|uniref:Glyoxalase-like domain-containing protein n=1 Tax=Neolewinella agarilytica TaxID=478744 RepID=A0A1H9IJH3_9BACT|nr:VOC family protein [Neolewinella agarilytica]SEQ74689.1 Glyoxalase-like domain-containing protein [Neolewinella agarilytica]
MIDHLVYLVHDLDEAAAKLGKALGVSFSPGGRHLNRGTKNVLLRIGPKTYFELMAVDPDNLEFSGNRWMGADHLPKELPGRLSRWGLQVNGADLISKAKLLETQIPGAGAIQPGSRQLDSGKTLRWQLTDPGTEAVRTLPFLIDWCGDPSPAERLPEVGCRLRFFRVSAPKSNLISTLCKSTPEVTIATSEKEFLRAELVGPAGQVVLTNYR